MRHLLFQKHSQKFDHNALNLEPYIQFETERITRSRVVLHSIHFHLDKDVLQTIQYAQQTGRNLYISREFLADLRYYALVDPENNLQSGLTFYTNYLRGGSQEALIRSFISTDGEIFHQIKSHCLERPEFCRQITSAHHWMIAQILSQLRLKALFRLNWLAWKLSWLIVVVIAIPCVLLLMQTNLWMVLALIVLLWLVQRVLQSLFRWLLQRWVLRQLLSRLLSRKPLEKKIARGILAWLEP